MTIRAGSLPAPVHAASPTPIRPTRALMCNSSGPAASWMAESTPSPITGSGFAEFTSASTCIRVISLRTICSGIGVLLVRRSCTKSTSPSCCPGTRTHTLGAMVSLRCAHGHGLLAEKRAPAMHATPQAALPPRWGYLLCLRLCNRTERWLMLRAKVSPPQH